MHEVTVRCGCGRTMALDARRGRGAFRCGCGVRISVAAQAPPRDRCVGTHKGEPCRLIVSHNEPFPLCVQHYEESGLAEYHTWSGGTPAEVMEEITRRVLKKTREFMDHYALASGVKRVEGHHIRKEKEPLVYFVRAGDLVKIGTTVDLVARLKTFNLPNLVVLATEPGYYKRERELHRRFRDLRHKGEWFRLEGALVDYINEIRQQHNAPPVAA